MDTNGNILIYQNENGDTKVDAYFNDSSIWMTQKSIAQLYQTSPQNITLHIKNIYSDGELNESSTCKDYLQVQSEGKRSVQRSVKIYNLDMILAIGYRVRNNIGMHFYNLQEEKSLIRPGALHVKQPINLQRNSMLFLIITDIFQNANPK